MHTKPIKITVFLLILALLLAGCGSSGGTGSSGEKDSAAAGTQLRGIWLAYYEYEPLGLTLWVGEETCRRNADRFLEEAQKYGIDTVFLQARAFDDAFWRSSTFRASEEVGGDKNLTAAEAYREFDPFGVFLEEAHKYGIKVHAWLNPYRVTFGYFYDPGDEAAAARLLTAVKELLAYESGGQKIDGIHLDDYFYHAGKGYFAVGAPDEKYAIAASEEEAPESGAYRVVTAEEKRENVNRMVEAVHRSAAEAGIPFGISPSGNYENDMNDGADVDTWLSEEGYVDYLIPQLYWTNHWGGDGNTAMFSQRLEEFLAKRQNGAKLCAGLGLYRTEEEPAADPGWKGSTTNLAEQISELQAKGADGYAFFSAEFLFKDCAAQELANVKAELEGEQTP